MSEKIVRRIIEHEMQQSYLDYAMSVIVGRALPDVRDGLKPVHRRVLFAMQQMSLVHNKPFRKCARIVGEVLGKYHPHGDAAVYDTLVRMAQGFSLRYPLVNGQGNFGSIDGDSAAAMRYCITGDSLILTDKGILPIDSISNKQETKINMKILSYNGKKNTASKFFDSGKHNIIELETELGYEIKGSHNHPILCWTLDGIPKTEWKLLKNITKKDIVVLNRGCSLFSKKNFDLISFIPQRKKNTIKFDLPKSMNKHLAFLLGALVAEGSFHQKKIIFCNSDMHYYNKIKNIIYDQFKGIQIYERKIAGNCLELEIYHQHVVNFLKNIGLREAKSDKKEIPFSVLQSTKKIIAEFLKGLFEGDGSVKYKIDKRHFGKSIELTYNSKSKKLISQLKILLLNFGIVTTSPYKDKRNGCYKLIISGHASIKAFKDNINFFSPRKISILGKIDSINPNRMSKTDLIPFISEYIRKKYKLHKISRFNFDRYNNLEKNIGELLEIVDKKDAILLKDLLKIRYLFSKVKFTKKLGKKKKVYSVKVDSRCHSFIASGFINHNTEAKLQKISDAVLEDIEKETVDFVENFDNSLKEPTVLPAKLPNLLINGSSGIAVGMATNIPPHNLSEVSDAIIAQVDNPQITIDELNQIIVGPDFPTAGIIVGTKGIIEAYKKGKGQIKVRARSKSEEIKGKPAIIITEIPYMVNKSRLIEQIADCVKTDRIKGIADLRDESDRTGMRIVIILKKDANKDVVLNQLYKHTRLQTTFGANLLALVNNVPKRLNLKQFISNYIDHRKEIVTKRTQFDLKKAQARIHIVKGLLIALKNIDPVIKLIRNSSNAAQAMQGLQKEFELSQKQTEAILNMRLQKLTALEIDKLKDENEELTKKIKEFKSILDSEQKVLDIIKEEITQIKQDFGDERRTELIEEEEEILDEDIIKEEQMVITITNSGYIKRTQPQLYKMQHRGGKGIRTTSTKEEDFVEHIFTSSTHSYILFFTDKGKVFWIKVYQLPHASRQAKGKAIVNLLRLSQDEQITAMIPIRNFSEQNNLVMVTKNGIINKTKLSEYSNPRKGGIIAIKLEEDNRLVDVVMTDGKQQLLIATAKGQAVRFEETDVRPTGRATRGVRGIRLGKNDYVVGMVISDEEKSLLTITENGFGKRTKISSYRLIRRGGKGVINIKCSQRNGNVADIKSVNDSDEIIFVSRQGILIRVPAKGISQIGRNTQGVRLMRLNSGDKVVNAARIVD